MDAAKAERGEKAVYDAGVLKNGHPCVGADEEVHPHGDHYERDYYLLRPGICASDYVRHRVAQQQAYSGGYHGQLQRAAEDDEIGVHLAGRRAVVNGRGGGEEAGDVIKGEVEIRVRERIVRHEDERDDDEQHRPHRIRCQQQALSQPR